jgi:hypothetical protein
VLEAATMIFFLLPLDGLIMLELSFEWDFYVVKLLCNKSSDSLVDKK